MQASDKGQGNLFIKNRSNPKVEYRIQCFLIDPCNSYRIVSVRHNSRHSLYNQHDGWTTWVIIVWRVRQLPSSYCGYWGQTLLAVLRRQWRCWRIEIFGIKFIRRSHCSGKYQLHPELVRNHVLVCRDCLHYDLGYHVLATSAWIFPTYECQCGAEHVGRNGHILDLFILKFPARLMLSIWVSGSQEIQLDNEHNWQV